MHLSDEGLLVILVVGIIAGWLAGKVVRGNGFGLVGDAAIGIVGALVGDWLLHRFSRHHWSHHQRDHRSDNGLARFAAPGRERMGRSIDL
jgi:uncharacterized membrane protein YeaQ/YmgE (transglycosylase-associated protein family)